MRCMRATSIWLLKAIAGLPQYIAREWVRQAAGDRHRHGLAMVNLRRDRSYGETHAAVAPCTWKIAEAIAALERHRS